MRFRGFLLFIIIFAFQGCSLAPIVSEKTARTLGSGNWEKTQGYLPLIMPNILNSENFDLNLAVESQTPGLYLVSGESSHSYKLRRSFNIRNGWFFYRNQYPGYYAGPIVSYKTVGSNFIL